MNRPCPVCTLSGSTQLLQQNYCLDSESRLPAKTTIVACNHCGFVFVNSDATAQDYRHYYSGGTRYESSVNASGSGDYTLDRKRIEVMVDDLVQHLEKGSRILDIGAAKGGVLLELKQRGFNHLYGVDPSRACIDSITSKGISACVGNLEDNVWASDPGEFDLIVLSHVMEHVYDVQHCLKLAITRLAEGGEIYIEVPDASRYSMNGFPPFYFFDPEHINHFDLTALQWLGKRVGLTTIRSLQKDLDVGVEGPYPAISAWLKPSVHETNTEGPIHTQRQILDYGEACQQTTIQMSANSRLLQLAQERTPVVLWGAGSHGRRMLANSPLANTQLIAIIDNDPGKQGTRLNGVTVFSEADGLEIARSRKATIAVAIAINPDEVIDKLQLESGGLEVLAI